MSSAISVERAAGAVPPTAIGQVVASYPAYEQAQRAVDQLADSAFPVEHAMIVGRDLRLVERITGRVTRTHATLMGAGSGAWWGLIVAAFLGFFLPVPEWAALIVTGALIGAVGGAIFGLAAHWATSGQRDFASTRAVVADRYDVTVTTEHSERASKLIGSRG